MKEVQHCAYCGQVVGPDHLAGLSPARRAEIVAGRAQSQAAAAARHAAMEARLEQRDRELRETARMAGDG